MSSELQERRILHSDWNEGYLEQTLGSPEDAWELFLSCDADGDGIITKSELLRSLSCFGEVSEEQLDTIFKVAAAEGEEKGLTFDDFCRMHDLAFQCMNQTEEGEDELWKVFDLFDGNKDGYISAQELQQVFCMLGEEASLEDCEQMINAVDANGDGGVDFIEFLTMMNP
eukprot:TRINITY_DN4974_c0_g1_i2.p1 TRINITY_DN4974_c0_g1~~TRINITY_DN4974_c0_g1_i2.p1  ORF type:complete len:170 (-),score=27.14 TRINITY_DN4974_c0_g1_i2:231-740(-)